LFLHIEVLGITAQAMVAAHIAPPGDLQDKRVRANFSHNKFSSRNDILLE
jgi:hypothetical protein